MNKQRILIIDDSSGTRRTLTLILKAKGYDPVSVDNGIKGIKAVSDEFFHFVLIDLMLPDMTGAEVLEKIKSLSPDTEAVIITGHASVDTAVRTMHDGAFSYVTKPVDVDYLLALIAGAAKKQKLQAERNRAVAALQESEERYRQFFEDDLSGAYISGPGGNIVACNSAFAGMFGFSSVEDAIGTTVESLYPDPSERTAFLKLLRNKKKLKNIEVKMRRIDGAPVHVIANSVGIFDEQGELTEIKGYLIDVTHRKNLELQLRHSKKMEAIGTLAGGIAHDFNNILFPMIGYAEMTLEELPETADTAQRNLREILRSAKRARNLVRQILTLSRRVEHEKMPIKIQPIIKEVLGLLRSSLPATIEIRQDINRACGYVLADPTQIHQVIMNLCTNAYHAMYEKGGILEVSLDETEIASDDPIFRHDMSPGLYLKLMVRDNGHGMSPEIIERIFDPYFTTKDIGKGTGIGLSIVHGIVRNHRGHIAVSSEPTKGTAFHVCLPVTSSDDGSSKVASDSVPVPGGTERILLVDDEEQIVEMEKQMLEMLGYEVTIFTRASEALETFRGEPERFDLIITDMTMPSMTGTELSKEIMGIRPDMPIILCSGFGGVVSKENAREYGIREFVTKPVLRRELAEAVRRALEA